MIATITFHRAINCGAALQSYALQCAIEDMGEKAIVIDYRCKKLEESYKLIHTPLTGKSLASDILHFPMQAIREHKFRQFQKKYISVTAPCYTLEDLSEIEKDFSMIITGSDQVWNLELTGHDKAYFLNFTNRAKRASYAASVGKKKLYEDTAADCCNELQLFEFLSVREARTAGELCEKLGKMPEVVVDPVFLLKVEQWNRIAKESKSAKPYIFVYCLHELSVYDEAKRLSEKTGLPIMRPLVLHYEKDENTWNLNDEFLVGEHLLVAPVLEQGQTKKMVYLPEGIWYDFNTGKRYEGKQYYLVDAPLDTCPMFAKAGSMIPAYEVMQYVGEKPYDTLNMLVFPGEGTYVHYQDNGSDFAYQGGAYNQYAFTQQENGEVTMKMMKEGYERPYKKIEYIFVGK